ncbi:MAG: sulfurtransferase TusA family protein [Selenomonadaceae bacterium]|nr:sulfurtransferase TusA family protein [Selenomonadaceae bacterium]
MKSDDFIDITDVVCPITFVKVKIALEDLDDRKILEIRMNEGEPLQNIPRSLKDEFHKILEVNDNEDGTFTLFVEKGGLK